MSEGHVTFLSRLRPFQRKGIFERLHTIDPEGYKELRKYISTLKRIRKREEQLVREEILDEMMIVVAQAEFEEHGITEVKFLPMNGILDNIALLLASGYTREQVRDKLGVDAELITKVTPERVKLARRALPEAIAIAADQKVLQDLMAGTVGKSTVAADQISVRRRKLRMDAEVQSGKLEKASSTMAGEIDDRHKMFFDVESEEVKDDENSDAGQTGED